MFRQRRWENPRIDIFPNTQPTGICNYWKSYFGDLYFDGNKVGRAACTFEHFILIPHYKIKDFLFFSKTTHPTEAVGRKKEIFRCFKRHFCLFC